MNPIHETAKTTAIESLNTLLGQTQDPMVAVLIFQAMDNESLEDARALDNTK
jgi:hypothetical protein